MRRDGDALNQSLCGGWSVTSGVAERLRLAVQDASADDVSAGLLSRPGEEIAIA
jgi:hypothetical protein